MQIDANFFMSLALQEAWKYQGLTYPNPAVGCCIVGANGEILAVDAHQKAGAPHAEVNALKTAYIKLTNDETILSSKSSADIHEYLKKHHNGIFRGLELYTTLEPCSHYGKTPSCASLISELGILKVFVGSNDLNPEAKNGNVVLENNGIEVSTEILKNECDALLDPFKKFHKKNFIFFKWAQRFNGTTDGMEISSLESRKKVHAMRDLCDLLVIGGNTVRTDRPRLDARLVDGKAPDVLIVSREKNFDQSIPLFDVKDRTVYIESDFSRLKQYNNIMIEGTDTMFHLTRDIVDYYLCFVAPNFGGSEIFHSSESNFKILNLQKDGQDIVLWMKRGE